MDHNSKLSYFILGGAHFWFTMHQNINIKLFLEFDDFVNFLLDGLNIIFLWDPNFYQKEKEINTS